jgi:hypothetical protein
MSKTRQHARRRSICLDDDDAEQPIVAVVDEPPDGHGRAQADSVPAALREVAGRE